MLRGHCKLTGVTSARRRLCGRSVMLLAGLAGWCGLSACATHLRARVVSIRELETAAAVRPRENRRAIISDSARQSSCYHALGPRLGMFVIRTPADWEKLRRIAPELGVCPDLSKGIVVGVASHAGLPLDGTWPIRLESVRVYDGAGFAVAHFEGGSYLPDGTTYLETAQIDGLDSILMVDIDGMRFYPR